MSGGDERRGRFRSDAQAEASAVVAREGAAAGRRFGDGNVVSGGRRTGRRIRHRRRQFASADLRAAGECARRRRVARLPARFFRRRRRRRGMPSAAAQCARHGRRRRSSGGGCRVHIQAETSPAQAQRPVVAHYLRVALRF